MLFDFHYHLLFKHYISSKNGKRLELDQNLETSGFPNTLNDLFGGPFDSQSSPSIVGRSDLQIGVVAILSLEYAFAEHAFQILGWDLLDKFPIDAQLFIKTRESKTSYYEEFKNQVQYHIDKQQDLGKPPYNIQYLYRKDWQNKELAAIEGELSTSGKRYMAFSIEGGHNLSNVPIMKGRSLSPELQLQEIQNKSALDFISMNLTHLSEITEQTLGGFAQGVNKTSQIAFKSDYFMPKNEFGLTETGKKVIRQALMHPDKPIVIDVKHMSLYTRLQYYQFRDKLIAEDPRVERLPIISSHSGFTFTSVDDYIGNKRFNSISGEKEGHAFRKVEPENRKIGRTNDLLLHALWGNPWTINLFDEDIVEIMESKGLIGISLDQRILGHAKAVLDAERPKYYEAEYVAVQEWERLFRDGQFPTAEKLELPGPLEKIRRERHIMLLCLHIVYAVRIGYEHMAWVEGTSPWDCICIGSDYDGLINPINGFNNTEDLKGLKQQLQKYLPQADKYLKEDTKRKALDYDDNGNVMAASMDQNIDKFLFGNGLRFTARYLRNWEE